MCKTVLLYLLGLKIFKCVTDEFVLLPHFPQKSSDFIV